MKSTSLFAVATLLGAFLAANATADPISVSLPGTTQFDGWATSELLASANPGFPGHPGSDPWPGAISSGDGTGEIMKTAGASYPGNGSLYSGGFSGTPNTLGASFSVSDASPVANLASVVFQVELSAPYGFDFYNGALPVLNYNGGTQALASALNGVTSISEVAFGGSTAEVKSYLLQWDLSAISGVTEFEIEFSNTQHGQIFGMQLDQGDAYQVLDVPFVSAVPEPSAILLGAMGLLTLGAARWARRKQA